MNEKQRERARHIFHFMEYEYLTDREMDFVESVEGRFLKKGFLSEATMDVLEDIFQRAAQREFKQ